MELTDLAMLLPWLNAITESEVFFENLVHLRLPMGEGTCLMIKSALVTGLQLADTTIIPSSCVSACSVIR